MRTIFEEAKLILSSSPDGLLFDDLYNLVGKKLNLDEEQYQENKLDLFNDLNNSIDVQCIDQKWFFSIFLNGRDADVLKKSKAPDIYDVNSFIDEYVPALEKEVEFSYMNRKRYLLTDGLRVDQNQGVFSYAFDSTDQINIPADSSIHIYLDDDHFLGRMVSCADDVVIFEAYVNFGEEIKEIEISTDTKQLLVALIDKLNNMRFIKGSIPERLVCDGKNQVSNKNIIKGQENAIEHASNEPITFIWGPPGTGKTHTLAKIALKFISEGKRVLMVSYSNVSVDGAIDRINRLSKKQYQNGEIIRYGYPRDEKLMKDSQLYSYSFVLSKNQELYKEYKDLDMQRHSVDKKSAKRKDIDKRLEQIRKHFKDEEIKLVNRSSFVATTVTKAVVDKAIYSQKFDLVLFDEASMAYVPHIIYTSSLAIQSFVCLGDYCQLPPIAIMKDTPLTYDIFEYVGISDAVRLKKGHNWLVMLNEQRRMVPAIADYISKNMYYNELISVPSMFSEHEEIEKIGPFENESISCIDLSEMYSICSSTKDSSYVNILSAMVTVNIVYKMRKEYSKTKDKSIGIITPYNAQARLLRTIAQSIGLNNVKCATVHQFQGSECDIILFDSVDCYLRTYPSNLLTSNRLVNVAMSRARGKFIFIGNLDYLKTKINESSSTKMIYNLIKLLDDEKVRYKDCRVYNAIQNQTGKLICGSEEQYQEMYYEDLRNTKKEICIDVRGNFKTEEVKSKVCGILMDLYNKGKNIIVRFDYETNIPKEFSTFSINAGVTNTVTIIDGKIIWHGLPSYNANFITQGEKQYHSLRPVFRMNNGNVASSIFNFLNLKHAAINEYAKKEITINRNCPLCGCNLHKLSTKEIVCSSKSCGYSEKIVSMDDKKKLSQETKIYSIYAGNKFRVCIDDGVIHVESSSLIQLPEFISIRNEKGKMKEIYRVVKLFEFSPKAFLSMASDLDQLDYKKLQQYFLEFDNLDRRKKYTFIFFEKVSKVGKNLIIMDKELCLLEYKDLVS